MKNKETIYKKEKHLCIGIFTNVHVLHVLQRLTSMTSLNVIGLILRLCSIKEYLL